jgi:predicted Holliday junction resolvase-like endonuclease
MDLLFVVWILLLGTVVGVLAGIILVHRLAVMPLQKKMEKLQSDKQSLSTTYGKITEQFAPFINHYPYSTQNFRFLGTPIDGVQFEKDQILFVEFKTHTSKLTTTQSHIKKLVQKGKVRWFEFRMK